MTQDANLSSWEGAKGLLIPAFNFSVSRERRELLAGIVESAFPGETVCTVSALRDYQSGADTAMYRDHPTHGLQGVYLVGTAGDKAPHYLVASVKASMEEEPRSFGAKIFDRLREHGVNVAQNYKTAAGVYNHEALGYTARFTEYTPGFHPFSSGEINAGFGRTLARMEQAFDALNKKDKGAIKHSYNSSYPTWAAGVEHWSAGLSQLATTDEQKRVFGECFAFLRHRVEILDPERGAPSHFDMNETNALWTGRNSKNQTDEGKVLDCDSVASGWAPRGHDLGTYALRVSLNRSTSYNRETLPDPDFNAFTSLSWGYNQVSAKRISPFDVADRAMEAAALLVARSVGLEALAMDMKEEEEEEETVPDIRLSAHVAKITPMAARAIEAYRGAQVARGFAKVFRP